MRRSRELETHAAALDDFREAFVKLVDMITDERPSSAISKQRSMVNTLSGAAAAALDEANLTLIVQDPPVAGGRQHAMNVVENWTQALEGRVTSLLTPRDVVDFAEQGASRLRASAMREQRRERTLAGVVARFIRWPLEVRDLAGLPPRSAGGRAAFGVAVLAQAALVAAVTTIVTVVLGEALR